VTLATRSPVPELGGARRPALQRHDKEPVHHRCPPAIVPRLAARAAITGLASSYRSFCA
jgi:hypothetical protein